MASKRVISIYITEQFYRHLDGTIQKFRSVKKYIQETSRTTLDKMPKIKSSTILRPKTRSSSSFQRGTTISSLVDTFFEYWNFLIVYIDMLTRNIVFCKTTAGRMVGFVAFCFILPYIIPYNFLASKSTTSKYTLTNLQLATEKLNPLLSSVFSLQNEAHYYLLELARDRIRKRTHGLPIILTFIHEKRDKSAKLFITQYANITAFHGKNMVSEMESKKFGADKEFLKKSLEKELKSNNVVVLWNIQDLESDLPLIIHSEADIHTTSNKNAFWILTVEVDTINNDCYLILDRSLKEAWIGNHEMLNNDQILPILSRISSFPICLE
uniref:TPM_phosphatase domain-containing protein n=1 Tax=Strongyloides papillosus TaxID=174720 RepID=A0A0N5BRM0_STREA